MVINTVRQSMRLRDCRMLRPLGNIHTITRFPTLQTGWNECKRERRWMTIKILSSGYIRAAAQWTHSSCDSVYKTCARPNPSKKRGTGHTLPPQAKEPLAIVSCWEKEKQSLSLAPGKPTTLLQKTTHQIVFWQPKLVLKDLKQNKKYKAGRVGKGAMNWRRVVEGMRNVIKTRCTKLSKN